MKKGGSETLAVVEKELSENWEFDIIVYKSPAERELKAVDLNFAIKDVGEMLEKHQVVAVFNADLWSIYFDQTLIVTSMLRSSAVSPRVYAFRTPSGELGSNREHVSV
ncbi:MAG: hypothetical protein QW182_06490 [Thermosphaera sp.]